MQSSEERVCEIGMYGFLSMISIGSGNLKKKMDGKLHVCNMILDPLCVLCHDQKDSAVTFF